MTATSPSDAIAGPSSPRGSLEVKRYSNGGPTLEDDLLHSVSPGRPSGELGTETIHEGEPSLPSDEVIHFPFKRT